MKNLLFSSLMITSILSASTSMPGGEIDLSWVDKDITAISKKRIGVSGSKINALNNPMKITKKKVKGPKKVVKKGVKPSKIVVKENPLKLKAIMNSKALVGSRWYQVNDTVLGYKILEITQNEVHLSSKKKKRTLFLTSKNKSIQIHTK